MGLRLGGQLYQRLRLAVSAGVGLVHLAIPVRAGSAGSGTSDGTDRHALTEVPSHVAQAAHTED